LGAWGALGLAALGSAGALAALGSLAFPSAVLAPPRLATFVGVSSGIGFAALRMVRAFASSTNVLKDLTSMPARSRWTMTSLRVKPLTVLANW
jgi:hypothetical protein